MLDTKAEVSILEPIPGIFEFSFTQVGGAIVAETSVPKHMRKIKGRSIACSSMTVIYFDHEDH
jgi:hypothetical protein